MKRFNTFTIAVASLVFALTVMSGGVAGAATLNVVGGQLVGASGVDVGGILYDVEFVDGFGAPTNCAPYFDGCDEPSDFAFTDSVTGLAAMQALIDQVFIDRSAGQPPLGDFDSSPDLIFGCNGGAHCAVFTPGVSAANPFGMIAAINFPNAEPDQIADYASIGVSVLDRYHTWARWSLSPIPEPNTALLLGIGLSALAVRRENR